MRPTPLALVLTLSLVAFAGPVLAADAAEKAERAAAEGRYERARMWLLTDFKKTPKSPALGEALNALNARARLFVGTDTDELARAVVAAPYGTRELERVYERLRLEAWDPFRTEVALHVGADKRATDNRTADLVNDLSALLRRRSTFLGLRARDKARHLQLHVLDVKVGETEVTFRTDIRSTRKKRRRAPGKAKDVEAVFAEVWKRFLVASIEHHIGASEPLAPKVEVKPVPLKLTACASPSSLTVMSTTRLPLSAALAHEDHVVAFEPGPASSLVTVTAGGTVTAFGDVAGEGGPMWRVRFSGKRRAPRALHLSANGELVLVVRDDRVHWLSTDDGALKGEMCFSGGLLRDAAISDDGTTLIVAARGTEGPARSLIIIKDRAIAGVVDGRGRIAVAVAGDGSVLFSTKRVASRPASKGSRRRAQETAVEVRTPDGALVESFNVPLPYVQVATVRGDRLRLEGFAQHLQRAGAKRKPTAKARPRVKANPRLPAAHQAIAILRRAQRTARVNVLLVVDPIGQEVITRVASTHDWSARPAARFSSDAKVLFTVHGGPLRGASRRQVRAVDPATGARLDDKQGIARPARAARVTDDGKYLAALTDEVVLIDLEPESGFVEVTKRQNLGGRRRPRSLAFIEDRAGRGLLVQSGSNLEELTVPHLTRTSRGRHRLLASAGDALYLVRGRALLKTDRAQKPRVSVPAPRGLRTCTEVAGELRCLLTGKVARYASDTLKELGTCPVARNANAVATDESGKVFAVSTTTGAVSLMNLKCKVLATYALARGAHQLAFKKGGVLLAVDKLGVHVLGSEKITAPCTDFSNITLYDDDKSFVLFGGQRAGFLFGETHELLTQDTASALCEGL